MVLINESFLKLPESYLFSEIGTRIKRFKKSHPEAEVIRLGIGDVTRPLAPSVIRALHEAVDEMSGVDTFRGYGPEQGYEFLREAVVANDFHVRGIGLDADEVFINDGAKSDLGNFTDLLGRENRVAVTDPVYPVYVDTNVMGGRAGELSDDGRWSNMLYLPCTAENGFVPELPSVRPDVIYLCFPNNPTGTTLTFEQLKRWVDYALEHDVLILFDAAYEAFIRDRNIPHSIYEIEGAKNVAVEFRSFSKTAGFTGLRCGYTVVPKELKVRWNGEPVGLNRLWNRRQCTKFNGTPYIVQRAAAAVYSLRGQQEIKENVAYYMENAAIIRKALLEVGYEVYGAMNAPYIWWKVPQGETSWTFFTRLLMECHIVGTPGVGFGPSGEGYLRLTAFGEREQALKAIDRIRKW